MRTIHGRIIIETIRDMCIEANYQLSPDIESAIRMAESTEDSPIGKKILSQLGKNMSIAVKDQIPICQDTGMITVFIFIGQDVHIEGINLEDAINEGIRQGYDKGYLRKSVVKDPIYRDNTKDNTPGIIHYEIVPGNNVEIVVSPKGFGSENMSRIYMLKPSDGLEGVIDAVIETVELAGPNACPPIILGVGIGGNFEKCAYLAKKALIRDIRESSKIKYVRDLEIELLSKINDLGIGPGGLGGTTTAIGVNVETYPTHIAGLPVAINICCHVNRHVRRVL